MSVLVSATTDPCEDGRLLSYIKQIQKAGADYVHFDVMDGKFVENKKLDAKIVKSLIKDCTVPSLVHLMVQNPQKAMKQFFPCGAEFLVFHYEAFASRQELVDFLQENSQKTKLGIAINPSTPASVLDSEILSYVKMILVLGVVPGKSGQKMIDGTLQKIKEIAGFAKGKIVACDGGINEENVFDVIASGANFISLGSLMSKKLKDGSAKKFLEQF